MMNDPGAPKSPKRMAGLSCDEQTVSLLTQTIGPLFPRTPVTTNPPPQAAVVSGAGLHVIILPPPPIPAAD